VEGEGALVVGAAVSVAFAVMGAVLVAAFVMAVVVVALKFAMIGVGVTALLAEMGVVVGAEGLFSAAVSISFATDKSVALGPSVSSLTSCNNGQNSVKTVKKQCNNRVKV
jgi:hypothetical protein